MFKNKKDDIITYKLFVVLYIKKNYTFLGKKGVKMGELFRFDNVRICMFPFDNEKHKEPHFHVELSNGKKVSISISNGKVLVGKIDNKTLKIIQAWVLLHKEELWDRWNNAVSGNKIEKIQPKIQL